MTRKVAGGENTNIREYYHYGDNAQYGFSGLWEIAQTFTPQLDNNLYAITVKIGYLGFFNEAEMQIQETDAAGKPSGWTIATSTRTVDDIPFGVAKWLPFFFPNFPQLNGGQKYAIVLRSPAAPPLSQGFARYQNAGAMYPRGNFYVSNDGGATWTIQVGQDMMFRQWGYVPPPPPPPPPALGNWIPTFLTVDVPPVGVTLTVTTDIPCHLFMRWTNQLPRKHPVSEYRRGMLVRFGTYFCFVVWEENEQIQVGDTYVHTFQKPDWAVCETRYFYFVGTKQDEEMPSATPVFYYHNEGVTMSYPLYAQIDNRHWTIYLRRYVSGETYAAARSAPIATLKASSSDRFTSQHKYSTNKYMLNRRPLYFDTTAIPADATILSAIMYVYTTFPVADNLDMVLVNCPELVDPPELADYGRIFNRYDSEIARCPVAEQTSSRRCMFKLTKAGLDSIVIGGWTKWGMICGHDIDDIAPVDTWEGNYQNQEPEHLMIAYAIP